MAKDSLVGEEAGSVGNFNDMQKNLSNLQDKIKDLQLKLGRNEEGIYSNATALTPNHQLSPKQNPETLVECHHTEDDDLFDEVNKQA